METYCELIVNYGDSYILYQSTYNLTSISQLSTAARFSTDSGLSPTSPLAEGFRAPPMAAQAVSPYYGDSHILYQSTYNLTSISLLSTAAIPTVTAQTIPTVAAQTIV